MSSTLRLNVQPSLSIVPLCKKLIKRLKTSSINIASVLQQLLQAVTKLSDLKSTGGDHPSARDGHFLSGESGGTMYGSIAIGSNFGSQQKAWMPFITSVPAVFLCLFQVEDLLFDAPIVTIAVTLVISCMIAMSGDSFSYLTHFFTCCASSTALEHQQVGCSCVFRNTLSNTQFRLVFIRTESISCF
uniref:Uncharacterized protein n=1 Tax=Physcomitrium patens TaxID=3218 RepID=A0A2K1LA47_PHYPA|nr:hypothetical protein PHYPA_001320 [Physcomitrium patens]